MDRRRFLLTTGVGALAANLRGEAAAHRNRVSEENAKEGSRDWQLTRVRADAGNFRSPWIEGYCSKQSVLAGETIDIMVSANPARKFRLEFFRLGYYGGRGARKVLELPTLSATTQVTPKPGEQNIHECRWSATHTLTIPADWMSGVYLGRMTTIPEQADEPYWQSYVTFIVKDERPADFLF